MNTSTYQISYSLDQPDDILTSLQRVLQQTLNQPGTGKIPGVFLQARQVAIIDIYQERSYFIAQLLASMGYQPVMTTAALDAYTLFLQGKLVPLAIILGQEENSDHLFLARLLQQMRQKYDWEVTVIRLVFQPSRAFLNPRTSSPASSQAQQAQLSSPILHIRDEPRPQTTTPIPRTLQPSQPMRSIQPLQISPSSSVALKEVDSETPEAARISLQGQSFGRYQILERLGSSAHSDVYKTYDRLREQHIALKAIQTNTTPYYLMEGSLEEASLFEREARLLAPLKHPHILPVLSCSKSYVSGASFIYKTMPYCAEGSLSDWLTRHVSQHFYAPKDVAALIMQLADALQGVHDQGVTYQNFKLSNLLIQGQAERTSQLHLQFADFAITQEGTFFSKTLDNFPFMAPEQWNGRSLPASDQYGLAVVAYRLLAGRLPFQENTEQVIRRMHLTMQPQPVEVFNPALSPYASRVLLRAMAKKPEERFESVAAFARILQNHCN